MNYFGSLICDKVSYEISKITHLNTFKSAIRNWELSDCLCRLYKNYMEKIGSLLYQMETNSHGFYS